MAKVVAVLACLALCMTVTSAQEAAKPVTATVMFYTTRLDGPHQGGHELTKTVALADDGTCSPCQAFLAGDANVRFDHNLPYFHVDSLTLTATIAPSSGSSMPWTHTVLQTYTNPGCTGVEEAYHHTGPEDPVRKMPNADVATLPGQDAHAVSSFIVCAREHAL